MAKAVKHLWNLSQDEVLREYADAIDKRERDRISGESFARREGLEKGIEKGIKKGIEKGRQEEKQNVILEMLKDKVNIKTIAKYTGVSEEKILQLQKKSLDN